MMNFRVVTSSPSLELSGANVLVANLLDELQKTGTPAEWIVTGRQPADDGAWLGTRQFKVHRLPPTKISDIRQRQKLLIEHLERQSPCIYLPNFDFDMACVAPALSSGTSVALIMHSDDPDYYDFVARHGELFNAIICVSEFLHRKLCTAHPEWRQRIVHIPFGVTPPLELPVRAKPPGHPLDVAYCGRLSFHQKRIQDLAEIILRCHEEHLPIRFHIAGTGPDERAFFDRIAQPLADGSVTRLGFISNPEVVKLLGEVDALLMTSDFEGLPVVLLEAMSRGCIPVVSLTESGIGEVVNDGENGFLLSIGDINGFVAALWKLSVDAELKLRLSQAAFDRIRLGRFTLERAAADYRKLFESLTGESAKWPAARTGKALVPRHYHLSSRLWAKVESLLPRAKK